MRQTCVQYFAAIPFLMPTSACSGGSLPFCSLSALSLISSSASISACGTSSGLMYFGAFAAIWRQIMCAASASSAEAAHLSHGVASSTMTPILPPMWM